MNDIIIHTDPDEKIVVYFSTRNLYDMAPAAYNSLLKHNPDVHAFLMIEDDTFPLVHPGNVTVVNVSGQEYFPQDGPNFKCSFTYMVLMKAAVPKMFPDAHRALLLDIDTIVNDDISALWDLDMSNSYYAAATEIVMSSVVGYPYSNFGVVMLNLDMLRDNGMDDSIIHALNTRSFLYNEQDAFNELCRNQFTAIPADYNDNSLVRNLTGTPRHSIITHFAAAKNWASFPQTRDAILQSVTFPRIAVYSGNRNYYKNMLAAAKSLLFHTPVDKIYFLIEDDAFPEPLPPVIECINVSHQDIFPLNGPNINHYYSYMTTVRAGLTRILPPSVSRVLWLDSDTIVNDDISAIWNYDISNYYYAAAWDVFTPGLIVSPYYNAGVMYMNLDLFRSTGMDQRVIDEINTKHYTHLEQDVLNLFCYGRILKLPATYNFSFISEPSSFPRIRHYLDRAKVKLPEAQKQYANLAWENVTFACATHRKDNKHVEI